tara:strand:- start:445 stop:579 length:135 start_codon:yes stop_codon:yes gene_type:complete
MGGYGASVHPDITDKSQKKSCFEASGIITYKNTKQGVMWADKSP